MTRLFIKSDPHKRGEEREGTYAARAQIGTEKDGSPMYRYFDTMEQYKNYMDKKGKKGKKPKKDDDDKESLKEKTAKEHNESTRKVRDAARRSKEKTLYINKDKTKKSLFVWRDEK